MLKDDHNERISLIETLNHEFLMMSHAEISQMTLRKKIITNLEEFWMTANLKNEIKSYGQFMASCVFPSSFIERIFEAKTAQNVKQVINGISYITDDLTLARFVVDAAFPTNFGESAKPGQAEDEDLKIVSENVARYFLNMYEK